MPRESGASSSHRTQCLLDHPPSRMMTVMLAAPRGMTVMLTTIYPLTTVANFAAHHMMNIMQMIPLSRSAKN